MLYGSERKAHWPFVVNSQRNSISQMTESWPVVFKSNFIGAKPTEYAMHNGIVVVSSASAIIIHRQYPKPYPYP